MKRVFIAFFAASFLTVFITIGGMALFGMGSGMAMDPCSHGGCLPTSNDIANGVACVNHCIQIVFPEATASAVVIFAILSFALFVFFSMRSGIKGSFLEFSNRARDNIGKLFLKQHLSTVILRN